MRRSHFTSQHEGEHGPLVFARGEARFTAFSDDFGFEGGAAGAATFSAACGASRGEAPSASVGARAAGLAAFPTSAVRAFGLFGSLPSASIA